MAWVHKSTLGLLSAITVFVKLYELDVKHRKLDEMYILHSVVRGHKA